MVRPSATPGDIYINDSFEAADALAKARTYADQKRWREAAELLQGTAESMSDHVVKTAEGYVSLQGHVSRTICNWPSEGLQAYQSLYDAKLQRELVALGDSPDVDRAVRLFDRYFCTRGAAAMGDRIAEFAIESGDLPLADWVLRRIVSDHPDRGPHIAHCKQLQSLLSAMRGSPPPLDDNEAKTSLRWKGTSSTLSDVYSDIANTFRIIEQPIPGDWPLLGGNPRRNRDSTTNVAEPGMLWRYVGRPEPQRGPVEDVFDALAPQVVTRRAGTPGLPIADGDFIYLQSHRDITAIRRSTGAVAWTMHSDELDGEGNAYFDAKPLGGESPTVDHGRLFAALPTTNGTYYDYETARTVHELVALDARTGELLWRVSQKGIDAQGTAGAFDSAPLVSNGRVYIVSRRRRSFGFEDAYLDSYRASDGKLLFRTHLASASTSGLTIRGATRSIAALDGDTLYVGSNLGTVAAVNAYTGGIRWLHLYDRLRPDTDSTPGWPSREMGQVPVNPLIASRDRVAVLPSDSSSLLVLSPDDGRLIQNIPVASVFEMHTLLGLRGQVLCGAGSVEFCYDLAANRTIWSSKNDDEEMHGRGMWVGDELFIPRRDGLHRFRVSDGSRQIVSMGSHYQGGHVLVLPELILISGSEELQCFVRKSEIWKDIQSRMAAAPDDPLPALEFAEVALGADEVADALRAAQEAVGRIRPSLSVAPPSLRARVFAVAIKLLANLPVGSASADIESVFQIVSESAFDSESNVTYRFRFADYFEKSGDPRRAIRLYQQILCDRSLRNWPPARSDAVAVRSHVVARQKVADLTHRLGPDVYAEFEAQARLLFEAARTAQDATELDRVIESFPNSQAAIDAAIAHAELLGSAGRHEQSAASWQRAYRLIDDPKARPMVLRRVAEHYERANRPQLAWLWLAKAAREYPEYTFDRDGRSTTFAMYRDALHDSRALIEPSRPRFVLPLQPGWHQDLVGPVQMLMPVYTRAPETDWNNVYVVNPDGIRGYDAATGRSLWPQPAPVRMNPELLSTRNDLAILATPFEVFALDVSTGTRRYAVGEYPARLADPGADWEDGASFRAHAMHADRLVSVREDGAATCIDVRSGEIVWTAARRPAPIGPMDLSESAFVYHISRGGRAVIQFASAATGELLETVFTDETRPVESFHLTLDGLIIMVTSKSFACFDPGRQERKWHTLLSNAMRPATLQFDLDSAYFIDDAGGILRIALDDGSTAWESPRLMDRSEENVALEREGENLFLSSRSSISAVDVANGVLLWQATTPEDPRLTHRLVSQAYIAALHVPTNGEGEPQVLFYDHRNASGVIPRNGGRLDLAKLEPRALLLANGAVIIQSGTALHAFNAK